MARPVFYDVRDSAVTGLLSPTDSVGAFMADFMRETRAVAKAEAPMRTGKLRTSTQVNLPKPTGPDQTTGALYANARHARWVIKGTDGPITPKNGTHLIVPVDHPNAKLRAGDNPGGGFFFVDSVAGQDANPYLDRAIGKTMKADPRVEARNIEVTDR